MIDGFNDIDDGRGKVGILVENRLSLAVNFSVSSGRQFLSFGGLGTSSDCLLRQLGEERTKGLGENRLCVLLLG